MKIIIAENYEDGCKKGAQMFLDLLARKPDALLGLATGDTPKGLYRELIAAAGDGRADFSTARTVNLDEYFGLDGKHDQSYRYFMEQNLFNHINLKPENITIACGVAPKSEEEARMRAFFDANPIDLQLLGIGRNGHIGFNEPEARLRSSFHYTALTEDTIEANSRMFKRSEDVPRAAYTMGVGDIMKAKSVLLLAFGPSKTEAVKKMCDDFVDPWCPATVLKMHPDATLIIDRELADAAGVK